MAELSNIGTLVCGTLATACKREAREISQGTVLADLAIDSLSLTALIAQLEGTFAIQLSPDQKMAIYDADDVAAIVMVATTAIEEDKAFPGER